MLRKISLVVCAVALVGVPAAVPTLSPESAFADSGSNTPPSGEKERPPIDDVLPVLPTETSGSYLTGRVSALNRSVVRYCLGVQGRRVGDGQCAALAAAALRQAGAKTYPYAADGNYVWGRLVATITPGASFPVHILPGDILQYRDACFYQRVTYPNGSSRTWTTRATHHTAVVVEVSATGRSLLVCEQNSNRQMIVKQNIVNLARLQQGSVKVYRPEFARLEVMPHIDPIRLPDIRLRGWPF